MVGKRKPKRKPTRREVRTIAVYGDPTRLGIGRYGMGEISEGRADPFSRRTAHVGAVAPRTQQVGGVTYHFYKRVSLRGTVKKIIDQLRKQGYKAKNFQVKRHIGRRALVVDNAIYTRPEHPNASASR